MAVAKEVSVMEGTMALFRLDSSVDASPCHATSVVATPVKDVVVDPAVAEPFIIILNLPLVTALSIIEANSLAKYASSYDFVSERIFVHTSSMSLDAMDTVTVPEPEPVNAPAETVPARTPAVIIPVPQYVFTEEATVEENELSVIDDTKPFNKEACNVLESNAIYCPIKAFKSVNA